MQSVHFSGIYHLNFNKEASWPERHAVATAIRDKNYPEAEILSTPDYYGTFSIVDIKPPVIPSDFYLAVNDENGPHATQTQEANSKYYRALEEMMEKQLDRHTALAESLKDLPQSERDQYRRTHLPAIRAVGVQEGNRITTEMQDERQAIIKRAPHQELQVTYEIQNNKLAFTLA